MHSNSLEACGMKCCRFWFYSEVKFLTHPLYSGEQQWPFGPLVFIFGNLKFSFLIQIERPEDRNFNCVMTLDNKVKFTTPHWEKSKQLAEQASATAATTALGISDGRIADPTPQLTRCKELWDGLVRDGNDLALEVLICLKCENTKTEDSESQDVVPETCQDVEQGVKRKEVDGVLMVESNKKISIDQEINR